MDAIELDEHLVARLLLAQFPDYAHLPVRKVMPGGNDNRTFRLGDTLTVRLPSAEAYMAAVEKERTWLPALAPQLPLPIPVPVESGIPGEGYPWPWSINRWLEGVPILQAPTVDRVQLAQDLAVFLAALREADAAGGPRAGVHSFYRGASLSHYEGQTREAIEKLGRRHSSVADAARDIWDAALESSWDRPPVWFHGDIAADNLLAEHGRLSGVIDFGTSGVGDPACDLVIAWTLLDGDARAVFHDATGLDDSTWARARGWALWKALLTADANPGAAESRRVLAEIIADPVTFDRGPKAG